MGLFVLECINSLIFSERALSDELWINGMAKLRSGINKNCLNCNISFYVKPYRINETKFCSRKCKDSMPGERIKTICVICSNEFQHILCRANKAKYCSRKCYYKGQVKKGTITFICKHCGKEYKGSPSRIGRSKYCSIQCINKESHKTFNPTFNTVRKAMLKRGQIDKCERCGYSECKKILGIHHKDRNRKNNKKENLEVLCPNCHSLEHQKHLPHGGINH